MIWYRDEWGAKPPIGEYRRHMPVRIILHHSGKSRHTGGRHVRAIQRYHQQKSWVDIGYHWIIAPDGTIYEGRPEDVAGAHTLGRNVGSIGICVLGDYGDAKPPEEAIEALAALVDMIDDRYGIIMGISGHKDHVATICPGESLGSYTRYAKGAKHEKEHFEAKDDLGGDISDRGSGRGLCDGRAIGGGSVPGDINGNDRNFPAAGGEQMMDLKSIDMASKTITGAEVRTESGAPILICPICQKPYDVYLYVIQGITGCRHCLDMPALPIPGLVALRRQRFENIEKAIRAGYQIWHDGCWKRLSLTVMKAIGIIP